MLHRPFAPGSRRLGWLPIRSEFIHYTHELVHPHWPPLSRSDLTDFGKISRSHAPVERAVSGPAPSRPPHTSCDGFLAPVQYSTVQRCLVFQRSTTGGNTRARSCVVNALPFGYNTNPLPGRALSTSRALPGRVVCVDQLFTPIYRARVLRVLLTFRAAPPVQMKRGTKRKTAQHKRNSTSTMKLLSVVTDPFMSIVPEQPRPEDSNADVDLDNVDLGLDDVNNM